MPRQIEEDRVARLSLKGLVTFLTQGIKKTFQGARPAPTHEHDQEDAAAADADKKVFNALQRANHKEEKA